MLKDVLFLGSAKQNLFALKVKDLRYPGVFDIVWKIPIS